MNKGILIGIIFILSLVGVYSLGQKTSLNTENSTSAPVDESMYSCVQDSDCISIRAGACGCSSGGSNTSINTKYKNEWEAKAGTAMCVAMISNNPTCSMTPRCIASRCILR